MSGRIIAIVGLLVTVSAILGSMVPSPDAADPMGTFIKLIVASLVMIGIGAAIYGVHYVRTRGQANG